MVSAEAIDRQIELSNQANGRRSPITGMGDRFIQYGRQYGVNPAVVVAIMQRESQLGADGSYLPTQAYNFAGLTAGSNGQYGGTCGSVYYIDRYWQKFCRPEDGIEGAFRFLTGPQYRGTGGRLEDVMMVYSPPYENDWGPMWNTFATVGLHLGTEIGPNTNIYSEPPKAAQPSLGWTVDPETMAVQNPVDSALQAVLDATIGRLWNWFRDLVVNLMARGFFIVIGLVLLGIGLWRVIRAA